MKRAVGLGVLGLGILTACGEGIRPKTNAEAHTASGSTKKRHVVIEKASARAPLFTEELDGLRRGVAAFLAKSDLAIDVVPIETVDALYGVAASGRRRDGGPLCSISPSAHSVILRAYPDALLAQTFVTCEVDETCELMVTLTDPPPVGKRGSYENVRTWVARTTRLDLVRAPAKLAVREDDESHGAGLVIGKTDDAPARYVDFEHLASTGTWTKPPMLADLVGARVEAEKCHSVSRRSSSYAGDVTLAVDDKGAVTRCELRSNEDPGSPDRNACYCRALQSARFGAGAADRRVALYVFERPTSGDVVANGKTYSAGAWLLPNDDGGVIQTEAANDGLSKCSQSANDKLRFKASVDVDGTGKIVGAAAEGEPKAARDCVESALLKVRATCTKDGRPRRIPLLVGGTVE